MYQVISIYNTKHPCIKFVLYITLTRPCIKLVLYIIQETLIYLGISHLTVAACLPSVYIVHHYSSYFKLVIGT